MAKEVKVLVACGSGVATSTIAQEEIKDIAKNAGVKIRLMKGTISEVPMKQKDVDVVFTTANYRNPLERCDQKICRPAGRPRLHRRPLC